MSPHGSSLKGYDGDFDGDVLSAIVSMSNQAQAELDTYYQSSKSMITSNANLYRGLASDEICAYFYYAMSYMPED